jgi:hypothetical protein
MTDSAEARVVAKTGEGLRTEVEAGGHTLVADEPESSGARTPVPRPTTTFSRPWAAARR